MHGIKPPRQISGGCRLRTHIIWLLARPCALLLVARLGRAEVKTTRRLPARPGDTLDRENEAGAKAKAARGHFASDTSPTQSIPTGSYRSAAW
jgi:hypothetical protein